MEQTVTLEVAKNIMGANFFGPDEVTEVAAHMNLMLPANLRLPVPQIHYTLAELEQRSATHVLVLLVPFDSSGNPLTLLSLRSKFGWDPAAAEPCFYNQDWYLNEDFANSCTIGYEWRLLSTTISSDTQGQPEQVVSALRLPTALCCAYTFFAFYFSSKKVLWPNQFLWCTDHDNNGDRVYVGRYFDPAGIAKNGFSVHRHLRITPMYGCVEII